MRLLLVEDHQELAQWVARALTGAGYAVDVLDRGDHAEQAVRTQPYDLVILDLNLPGMDGLDVLHRMRQRDQTAHIPVLVLTARGATEERVRGLNLGADDYLAKPFELSELEARIKALLRRACKLRPQVRLGLLEFDLDSRLVTVNGQPLPLTPRELAVLEALLARQGRPIAREHLFEKVFSFDQDARPEAIEIYIHRLRKKLEGSGVQVRTLRGLGYLIDAAPGDAPPAATTATAI